VMPEPARVFSFPTARKAEEIMRTPEPVLAPTPAFEPEPETAENEPFELGSVVAAPEAVPEVYEVEEPVAAEAVEEELLELETPMEEAIDEVQEPDELVLETQSVIEEPIASNPVPPVYDDAEPEAEPVPRRRWLVAEDSDETAPAAAPAPSPAGATLFERMSNIARGQAKAEPDTAAKTDPLDIPRFLNRQNNQ